jgi:hypothetical protein
MHRPSLSLCSAEFQTYIAHCSAGCQTFLAVCSFILRHALLLLLFRGGSLHTPDKHNLVTKTIRLSFNRSVSSALMHWTSAPATFTPRWRPGTVAFWEAGIDGHLKPPHVARLQGYFPVPEHLSLGTSPSVFRRCNRATQSRRNGR